MNSRTLEILIYFLVIFLSVAVLCLVAGSQYFTFDEKLVYQGF